MKRILFVVLIAIVSTNLGQAQESNSKELKVLQKKLKSLDDSKSKKEALLVAEEIDKVLTDRRTMSSAIDIAWRYCEIGDVENAYKWAKTSADRNFQNYNYYSMYDNYKLLQGHPKFNDLIEQIKLNAGIGKPAIQFSTIDVTGKEISLNQYLGKVVLLDFWETSCGPCVASMPYLSKLYDENRDKGFEIIGISLDKDKNKLGKFIKKKNIGWPIICSTKGWNDDVKELYNVNLIPATYIIDKKGILRHSQISGEKLRKAVIELMNE
jgi:peroxiredoxin